MVGIRVTKITVEESKIQLISNKKKSSNMNLRTFVHPKGVEPSTPRAEI